VIFGRKNYIRSGSSEIAIEWEEQAADVSPLQRDHSHSGCIRHRKVRVHAADDQINIISPARKRSSKPELRQRHA